MDNTALWIIILITFAIIMLATMEHMRKTELKRLSSILYDQKDSETYLKALESKKLKFLFSNASLEDMRLNAYLYNNDDEKIEKSMKLLSASKMGRRESLDFNKQKLTYYCIKQNKKKASEALIAINKLEATSIDKEAYKDAYNFCNTMYGVYIEHDRSIIQPLVDGSSSQSGENQGVTYFWIAKLYYYDKQITKCKEYLTKAKPLLKDTKYEEIIELCQKDLKKIEKH